MNSLSPREHVMRTIVKRGGPESMPPRRQFCRSIPLVSAGLLLAMFSARSAPSGSDIDSSSIPVLAGSVLSALLAEEDTDADLRITALDAPLRGTKRGDKEFSIPALGGRTYNVYGTQALSNLLQ